MIIIVTSIIIITFVTKTATMIIIKITIMTITNNFEIIFCSLGGTGRKDRNNTFFNQPSAMIFGIYKDEIFLQ